MATEGTQDQQQQEDASELQFPKAFRPVLRGIPKFYQTLSWMVYLILESVGASLEVRRHLQYYCSNREIVTQLDGPSKSLYVFGSRSEGTTTFGLDSDVDQVIVFNELPVVTHATDHPNGGACLLLVEDQTTHPGYCKLQVVENGMPKWGNNAAVIGRLSRSLPAIFHVYPDKNNRLVCTFEPFHNYIESFGRKQGPALTIEPTRLLKLSFPRAVDYVFALQCKDWPVCASEWLTRQRHFGWPSNETIKVCSTLGCLFVQVGHPDSDEQNKLWRVSLSHQERYIVNQFNSVQLKCLTLLKIIRKELIAPYIPNSLSSYHLKTCILYLIENTPPEFWIPENLLVCTVACLKLLSHWTTNGYCPNYFIPAENMFDRHVRGVVKQELHQRLQYLISSDCHFLAHIQTDTIGTHLQSLCVPSITGTLTARYLWQVEEYKLISKLENVLNLLSDIFQFSMCYFQLDAPPHRNILETQVSLYKKLKKIKDNKGFRGHTHSQTQRAKALAIPYTEMTNMCSLVSLAVHQGRPKEQIWSYLASEKWFELSLQSDSFSSMLKQATCMYMLGYYHESLDILSPLTSLIRFTHCSCMFSRDKPPSLINCLPVLKEDDITAENLLKNYILPCACFLPTEKDIIPTALCYELKRTEGLSAQLPLERTLDYLHKDHVVVDAQFLLYFLLYLNHAQLNMNSHACADISNMEWVLDTREVSHRATCLNLLGWTYKKQGLIDRAEECWRMSIEVRPSCNAAHWHIRRLPSFGQ